MKEPLTPFGIALRAARKAAKMFQGDVAERLGIDQSQVSRWESGQEEPTLHAAQRLAKLLDPRGKHGILTSDVRVNH